MSSLRKAQTMGLLCTFCTLLAACGQPTPIILTPPAALLTCMPAPAIPAELPAQGTVERDKATVELWLAEREAGADCRAQLSGVRVWVDTAGKD